MQHEKDASLVKSIYKKSGVLINESADARSSTVEIHRMFNATTDQTNFDLFDGETREVVSGQLPVYESKLIWHFDHRFSTYSQCSIEDIRNGNPNYISSTHKYNASFSTQCRYAVANKLVDIFNQKYNWYHKWYLGVRMITSPTNERTFVSSIIPFTGSVNSLNLFVGISAIEASMLLGSFNSFVMDYITRTKVGNQNLNQWILKQLPILSEEQYCKNLKQIISKSVLELSFTCWDLQAFAKDSGYDGTPFIWDEERRFRIRSELDAIHFHLYLGTEQEWKEKGSKELQEYFPTPRDAVDYIMETFPIVKRKDEKKYGSYRTKELILEIYDKIAEAIKTGQPYQTILDPPPADPRVTHSARKDIDE